MDDRPHVPCRAAVRAAAHSRVIRQLLRRWLSKIDPYRAVRLLQAQDQPPEEERPLSKVLDKGGQSVGQLLLAGVACREMGKAAQTNKRVDRCNTI